MKSIESPIERSKSVESALTEQIRQIGELQRHLLPREF